MKCLFKVLLIIQAVRVKAYSESFALPEGKVSPAFSIEALQFNNLHANNKNCSFNFDKTVILACESGWLAIDEMSSFLKSRKSKVSNSD